MDKDAAAQSVALEYSAMVINNRPPPFRESTSHRRPLPIGLGGMSRSRNASDATFADITLLAEARVVLRGLSILIASCLISFTLPALATTCQDSAILIEEEVLPGVTTHTCMLETPDGVVAHGEHEVRADGEVVRSGSNHLGKPVGRWYLRRKDGRVQEVLTYSGGLLVQKQTFDAGEQAATDAR